MTESVLEKINNAALKFLVPLNQKETFATIVDEALKLIDAAYGTIILEQGGQLERVYVSSPLAKKTINRKKGNTYKAFITRQVIIVNADEIQKSHPILKKNGIQSSIYIPLAYQSKIIGVLAINSQKQISNTTEELKVLRLFGAMASLAIRKTQLYDQTKKALEMRDFFISVAAHELRTPLTSIYGYIQLLQKKFAKNNGVETEWTKEMYGESMKLTNIINELLEVNRIQRHKEYYFFREVHLKTVFLEAISKIQLTYPHHKFVFDNRIVNNGDMIIADEDKLLQVIISLLDNAAKFSQTDSQITTVLQVKKPHILFQVTDQGKGISKQDTPHIFDGFYKGRDSTTAGLGVGLLIAKHIINSHHGELAVKSAINKGTKITVELPLIKMSETQQNNKI